MLEYGRDLELFLESLVELKNIVSEFFYESSKHNNDGNGSILIFFNVNM